MAKLWWMIQKDMLSEYRARRVWPAMLLFGVVVALVFGIQMDLVADQRQRIAGSLLWLATFLAGMLAIDRSFASEREEACWQGLLTYPLSPSWIFLAKLTVNVVALAALQAVLIPLFVVFSDVPLLIHPWAMCLVALLGNLGISALGTLLGALATGIRDSGNLLAILAMPMAVPVGPTWRDARNTSRPPPEPRSTTVSPSRREAMAVGLPQDSPMLASSGILASSSSE